MDYYTIDINRPSCWREIINEYKEKILKILHIMRPLFSDYLYYFKIGLTGYKIKDGIILFENEIREIARILQVPFEECLLLQLTYELNSACTY